MSNALTVLIEGTKDTFLSRLSDKNMSFEAESGFAIQALSTEYSTNIALKNKQSVIDAVTNVAAIGLSLNPAKKQAYLVPRGGKICLDISYMGLIDLAIATGSILWAQCVVVYENDEFTLQGYDNQPIHKFNPFSTSRGNKIGAYACVKTPSGDYLTHAMSLLEVFAIRDRSEGWKAGKSTPWKTDENEMIKKGLALDTPIPTPSGWTTMGDLQIGDEVFDKDGEIVVVKDTSEIKEIRCFKVTMSNGDEIICDDEHRWIARCGDSNACLKPYSVITINEMYDAKAQGLSVTIPFQGALNTKAVELPIDPYLLGYWLGDGSCRRAEIACGGIDLESLKNAIVNTKYQLGSVRKDKRADVYNVGVIGGFREDLITNGLLNNKHVPAAYLRASVEQRKQLLAGLLDSDGHIDKARGKVHFYNKNKVLSDAVFELATSLGEAPTVCQTTMRGFGVETITNAVFWKPSFCPCINPRKAANYRGYKILRYRGIYSINVVPTVPTRCISVTGHSETYLAGKSMTPTHNTVIKQAYKYWPKTSEAFKQALHYLNVEAGEGLESINAQPVRRGAPQPVAIEIDYAEQERLIGLLELSANNGVEAFRASWAALEASQRVLVGTAEKDRIKTLAEVKNKPVTIEHEAIENETENG